MAKKTKAELAAKESARRAGKQIAFWEPEAGMGERYDNAAKRAGISRSAWLGLAARARLKASERRKGTGNG